MDINYNEEIIQYTRDIWSQILGLDVQPTEEDFKLESANNTLSGCVQIMGAWKGSVILICPVPLARKAAAIMFSIPEEQASQEDIKDALGEITNMTGGNIKSLVHSGDEQCVLSLPAVAFSDNEMHVPGTKQVSRVNFKQENQTFVVCLMKKVD
ncbi:MAG: chemotaxis protein CheX [Candidatus Nitrohelix vancouverensis]|uniref:Chemotaxis protein CheX n=1 Tax=Candidatus Nitrohelix vancouverensis TaxID=2705534 RepID=A0A7T0C417_9BACT|nr:MAG: chemotaxis protein CheX [Candidatus Nitrohelix vancouverensis]